MAAGPLRDCDFAHASYSALKLLRCSARHPSYRANSVNAWSWRRFFSIKKNGAGTILRPSRRESRSHQRQQQAQVMQSDSYLGTQFKRATPVYRTKSTVQLKILGPKSNHHETPSKRAKGLTISRPTWPPDKIFSSYKLSI